MNSVSAYREKLENDLVELQTKYNDLLIKLETWLVILSCSDIDSKAIVKKEIKKVLKE